MKEKLETNDPALDLIHKEQVDPINTHKEKTPASGILKVKTPITSPVISPSPSEVLITSEQPIQPMKM